MELREYRGGAVKELPRIGSIYRTRRATSVTTITNAMTVDVEDYFQVSAFASYVPRDRWAYKEYRVAKNMERILQMFSAAGVKATFFTLGYIAQQSPALIRRIVAEGHELASHGCEHDRVTDLGPKKFKRDIQRSKALLEDTGGAEVKGYRAPSYSIDSSSIWAFDILQEEGYQYSSSVYPIQHDHYGMPNAPTKPFRYRPGAIPEIPIATTRIANRRIPSGGGGYFRLYPYALSRWLLNRINNHEQRPAVFYFHPWEIDPDQPRQPGLDAKTRFRHYLNLNKMEGRLRRLLNDFAWDRMDRVFLPKDFETHA